MKMTKEHFTYIFERISQIKREDYFSHKKSILSDSRVKDIEKRLRWDCFYAIKGARFACDELYAYLDDSHIDTALRTIQEILFSEAGPASEAGKD